MLQLKAKAMLKQVSLVMLPTKEKSKLVLSFKEKSFNQLIEPKLTLIEEANYQLSNIQSKHLYITSDDKIKEGDCWYNTDKNIIQQWNEHTESVFKAMVDTKHLRKVIATTDSSLKLPEHSKGCMYDRCLNHTCDRKCQLPRPSDSFIQKFIEEYNKGNVITDVLVDYECPYNSDQLEKDEWDKYYSIFEVSETYQNYEDVLSWSFNEGKKHLQLFYKVKVNPKDNTITIKKVKDSWNREEVVKLLNSIYVEFAAYPTMNLDLKNKWIEENL